MDISAIIHLSLGRLPDCVCGSRGLLEKTASCSCPPCFPGNWVSKIHFRKRMLHVLFIAIKGGIKKVKIMNKEQSLTLNHTYPSNLLAEYTTSLPFHINRCGRGYNSPKLQSKSRREIKTKQIIRMII